MCGERGITFVDHIDTIDTKRHLNERKIHLNKSRTTEFVKNANFHCSKTDIALVILLILP